MKKILTSVAMVLLLVGCAKQYDDSAIQTRIADLERRVTSLESSVDALKSAIGEGVFVAKVQEYADPETGKTIGVTITYTNGDVKYFEITPKADYAGPVVSIIRNGAGELVWAVDGVAIKDGDGNEVTVYQTPVFTIDGDGNLLVSIDGSDPVILGQVQNEGATLVDGIFTNIKVEQDKVVLTLSDNTVVNIPFAEAFKLNIETTEYVFTEAMKAIEIPYTVTAKTSGTVVGVSGYSPKQFTVKVEEDKIVVTPLSMKASAVLLVYADSKVGLTSLASVTVEAEGVEATDAPYSETVDYMAEGEDASVAIHVVSNVEFDVKPQADWISVVSVKSQAYVITLSLANNETGALREGVVNITKKGTETVIQSITIAQDKIIPGPKDLGKNETANSYIVTAPGEYKFAAVKGNSTESVGTVAKAELYWETYNNAEEVTVNSVIAAVGYEDGYITFSTPATLKPGNAVIAAKNADDVILWSWHIWIPATEITTNTYGIYSSALMDRNLGALVAASVDAEAPIESYGFFYQWGRKDPFPGPAATSGSGFAKTTGPAPSQLSGDGATDACKISLERAIKEPLLMGRSNNGDWLDVADNTLWVDEAKTMYDPCPAGYRVPARIKADPLHSEDFSAVTGWSESLDNHYFTMGDPQAVFPFSGYLDDYDPASGVAKNGIRTLFWTAHKSDDAAAYCMNIRESTKGGNKHALSTAGKSRAGSVRCVVIAAE